MKTTRDEKIVKPGVYDDDDAMCYRTELEEAIERNNLNWIAASNFLVRAEREACAQVCEEYETANDITATWLNIVANAIRARGETK